MFDVTAEKLSDRKHVAYVLVQRFPPFSAVGLILRIRIVRHRRANHFFERIPHGV